ncbi:protein-disulfide reductase DsbD family protein [Sphingomonas sp. BGYR3]|uniref:protein-disulfide reductase DsbD family protein n=1 Tax=Sphingomonas sp. BGYR3 TaxID=2975483 RepID=UPI0021A7AD2A|nr:thioredoxin family protein [Sphingomonas sp. BGYR3]MDG5487057.1 protein-disulfide reductase DsbD family protein [Sphingomonas sp. BGYR3]
MRLVPSVTLVLHALMLAAAMLLTRPAWAQGTSPGPHIAIDLVAETDRPAPGGTVTLAFDSRPDAGWHGYWLNPGAAGVATRYDWTLPAGVTAGAPRYPVPHRLIVADIMNYVYEGPFAPLVTLTLDAGLAPGTRLPVSVRLDYLVCTNEICVPERAERSITLTVGDGAVDPGRRARFDAWRQAIPPPIGSAASFALSGNGDARTIRLAIPFPADRPIGDAYFFPLTGDVIDYDAPQRVVRDGDRLLVETRATGTAARIEGVIATDAGRGFAIAATPGDVPALPSGGVDWGAALIALLGALAGGVLLNVMPCVFPILSLKALSLAKAGGEERQARREALAYTAGVVLVCLALGGLLLALRAGGASVGWAFQLQNPQVILILLLLVTAIALNLAGLFEMTLPGPLARLTDGGSGGAFMTGALAAFVATPCSGPFMAAALGAALVLPVPVALAIFAGLGLGLALPFLLLGFVPALRRRLPKPGTWMVRLRHLLSVPMFLTALALAWVLGQQAGVGGMTLGLGAALLFGLGLWWSGGLQRGMSARAWLPGTLALVLGLAAIPLIRPAPANAAAEMLAGAEPFSEARLAALRAEGRPVFAYFTADWCVTCKVNERTVIDTDAVRNALSGGKVAVLVGDWTDGDPALGRFIEANGRAGVPLYLWYAPGKPEPDVLPQILTQSMLTGRAGAGGS